MINNRFTFRVWTGGEMIYFKLGDNLPPNWSYWNTCMQNTCLKDKNGKEIYEGDVFAEQRVGREDEPFGKVAYDTDLGAFTVEKSNGGWVYLCDFLLDERRSRVVGNIYENPELLTK